MQNETGGYCAMCDTVWAEPGKCRCMTIIEGETIMTDDNLDDTQQYTSTLQEHDKTVWNEAIEAAANIIDQCNREGPYNAIRGARRIRELKK